MKKVVFLFLFSTVGLSIFSCKKDAKTEKLSEENPVVTDSIIEKDKPKGVVIEEYVKKKKKVTKKKKEVAKKKKPTTTKNKETKFGKDGGSMKIPGTSLSTNHGMAKKYIYDYENYVARYRKAVAAKDMDSFLRLSDASSSLSRQYTKLMSILPGEEIEKLSQYMDIKSKQLNQLSSQM